jgi:photosystem II stability/assembly factor-like uncharacterized protein
MKQLAILSFIFLFIIPFNNTPIIAQEVDTDSILAPMKWRNIGPFRGGRSVASSGVISDPLTYYMGTTGGGLWKTEDAGQFWTNISDGYFKTGSVGAVAVAESDPNVVYCGMGEHAPRAVMTSHGDGMYKSTDAGKTWKHIGLETTQHIAEIKIHPSNPDIVYVAVQGNLYGPNKERGVYKTEDGGASWKNILFVNDETGCADIDMDMSNPRVLYAAMWEHGRRPWQVISGGPGSGLYKSTDGGDNWKKIQSGLPDELGKMAVSICRSEPDRVYALVESDSNEEKGGLFVSDNAGGSWKRISKDHRLVQRAWYYIEVFADPINKDMVYVLSAPALRSSDGGKTWERLTGTHGDFHDLWIHPTNPKNICIANDGGAAISFNRGETWSRQDNMPTAQFYRISVDNQYPYNIYAGQQDNSSVRIASQEFGWGITQRSWTYSAGGESAFLAFDPDDPRYVLGGSYLGTIEVLDTKAEASTNIMAAPIQYLGRDASDMKYRYNWNAPIIWSQHEENTYYHGAQFLLKTKDLGISWTEASPDLTRNEKSKQGKGGVPYTNEAVGAENYGTIAYVIESPHEEGVIWVGSDDGLVHITKDNCANWTNVTPAGLEECLINAIDVSPHDPATAYIATTRYKFNDHTPALYKTTNYGKTWTNITNGIPKGAFTRVVREDDVRQGLLYAGTETGVYVSWNDGQKWYPLQLNLPITPITDLAVKNNDLVAATSGRSFWILDDLDLLRQIDDMTEELQVFTPEKTMLVTGGSELNASSASFDGTNPMRGVNPANGAVIYYNLPNSDSKEPINMTITDATGQLVRSYTSEKDTTFSSWAGGPPGKTTLGKKEGLNRIVWDLRYPIMEGVPGVYIEGSYRGHRVMPGTYTITVTQGEKTSSSQVAVSAHPLYNTTVEEYEEYHAIMSEMESTINNMHTSINDLAKLRKEIADASKKLSKTDHKSLLAESSELIAKMKKWDDDMVQRKSKAYDDVENFPNKLSANYLFLLNQTESDIVKVTEAVKERKRELDVEWSSLQVQATDILNTDIPEINEKLWKAGIGAIQVKRVKP